LQELATCMAQAYGVSQPSILAPGEWHLPYIYSDLWTGKRRYFADQLVESPDDALSLEDAIIVSCARCAAVSYRNVDYDLTKCKEVYNRLVNTDHLHGSALEHCATPMKAPFRVYANGSSTYSNYADYRTSWQDGISHTDREGNLWSGNFKGFIQYRKTIPGECYVKTV
jgi:hypothetical protein